MEVRPRGHGVPRTQPSRSRLSCSSPNSGPLPSQQPSPPCSPVCFTYAPPPPPPPGRTSPGGGGEAGEQAAAAPGTAAAKPVARGEPPSGQGAEPGSPWPEVHHPVRVSELPPLWVAGAWLGYTPWPQQRSVCAAGGASIAQPPSPPPRQSCCPVLLRPHARMATRWHSMVEVVQPSTCAPTPRLAPPTIPWNVQDRSAHVQPRLTQPPRRE